MFFFANWKASVNGSRALALARGYVQLSSDFKGLELALFPSVIDFHAVREICRGTTIILGVQSVGYANLAAQTGELSPRAAKAAGVRYVLVGHSERRQLFGETDQIIARRLAGAFEGGLIPILCVGETALERRAGRALDIVRDSILSALQEYEGKKFFVAYEPVWAIGAGRAASEQEVMTMHRHIRAVLIEKIGARGVSAPILYGGSVHAKNIRALVQTPEVGGVLVGTASASFMSARALMRSLAKR